MIINLVLYLSDYDPAKPCYGRDATPPSAMMKDFDERFRPHLNRLTSKHSATNPTTTFLIINSGLYFPYLIRYDPANARIYKEGLTESAILLCKLNKSLLESSTSVGIHRQKSLYSLKNPCI